MYIKVKVKAGAKEDKITLMKKDSFDISVKAPAERNLANKKVIELVRKYFKARLNDNEVGQVYNGDVRIVSGHHSQSKIISVEN
ncbi:MAG: DUF167 domain-containing protein [Candidatus Taylorbacteria bacterium]|nr:DUF167 domain-containing protein [Candidatus Taylorbacteria bacterium]